MLNIPVNILGLQHPCIPDFGEKCSIGLYKAVIESASLVCVVAITVIIRIAEEEYCLGINFV